MKLTLSFGHFSQQLFSKLPREFCDPVSFHLSLRGWGRCQGEVVAGEGQAVLQKLETQPRPFL